MIIGVYSISMFCPQICVSFSLCCKNVLLRQGCIVYNNKIRMGTSQSRGRQEQYIQVNHPRFSNSKMVSINSARVLQTDINTQEHSYDRWRSSITQHHIDPKKYRFLLLPLTDSNLDKCAPCTNRRNLTVTFDNYPLLLTDAIDFLNSRRSAFSEPELWHLLYAICAAEEEIANINGYDSKLGDVRPENVFLSQKGKIKLANQYSWPGEYNAYQKLQEGHATYMAPEDIEGLRKGVKRLDSGVSESSELYSLGLTLLSAGILKQNKDLYDVHNMRFNTSQFLRRINFWLTRQRYSENLRILVAYLCHLRIYKRWNFNDLWRWLSRYRAKIGAHQFFGNDVQLPQLFAEEKEQLHLSSPYLAQLPEDYSNSYGNLYQPRLVLTDKTKQEQEAELNRLKGSNASSRVKSNKSQISPKNSRIHHKDSQMIRFSKYGEPDLRCKESSVICDADMKEITRFEGNNNGNQIPANFKQPVEPLINTNAETVKEQTTIGNTLNIAATQQNDKVKQEQAKQKESSTVYSYPYHPQYYNPHVRYISPSTNRAIDSTNKRSIIFTYSQVGTSQVKPQISKIQTPLAKEELVSQQKKTIVVEPTITSQHLHLPNMPEDNQHSKLLNNKQINQNIDTLKMEPASIESNRIEPAVEKPDLLKKLQQPKIQQKQENIKPQGSLKITKQKSNGDKQLKSNPNKGKIETVKSMDKKDISSASSAERLRKSGASSKGQTNNKHEIQTKIIFPANSKPFSSQYKKAEITNQQKAVVTVKPKQIKSTITIPNTASIKPINQRIDNPPAPISLKLIKQKSVTDKYKSPTSYPAITSPKGKQKHSSPPASPKIISKKLTVSEANKQSSGFITPPVSRIEGQHIYLKHQIEVPKQKQAKGLVTSTKIRSVKQIEPKAFIKRGDQAKQAKLIASRETTKKQSLLGNKTPIFEGNKRSLYQSKVVINSRIQPSTISQLKPSKIEERQSTTEAVEERKNVILQPSKPRIISQKQYEQHGIFRIQSLNIRKAKQEKPEQVVEQPHYDWAKIEEERIQYKHPRIIEEKDYEINGIFNILNVLKTEKEPEILSFVIEQPLQEQGKKEQNSKKYQQEEIIKEISQGNNYKGIFQIQNKIDSTKERMTQKKDIKQENIIKEMQQIKIEGEKTIQHIQPKIIEAEKTIIEAEKTIQHIQPKIIEAEKTIIEAEKTIQHIQPKIIEAEKTIQHIQPKIIEAEKTIQHIQPKIIEAEKTIIEAEKTIQHIQPKIIEAEKTIIEAEKTIQHIQPKIIEAEKTIQHIQPKIIEAEKTIQHIQPKIIEAEKTIQHIQPKIIEAEKTIQHIQPKIIEAEKTIQHIQPKIIEAEKTIQHIQPKIIEAEKTIQHIQPKIIEAEKTIIEAEKTIQHIQPKIIEAEKTIIEAEKTIQHIQPKIIEAEKTIIEAEKTIQHIQPKIIEAEKTIIEAEKTIQHIQPKIIEAEKTIIEAEKTIQHIQPKIIEAEKTIQHIQPKIIEAEKTIQHIQPKIIEAEKTIIEAEKTIQHIQPKIIEAEKTIQHIQPKIIEAEKTIIEAEKTIQHIQPKIIEAEKTIIEAEKTIQHIQPKIIEAEKTIIEAEKTIQHIQPKIIEAEKTIQHIQPKIIEAEKTIQHIQPKIIEAEKTIIEAEKTIQHIQPKIIEAEKTIQHIQPKIIEAEKTIIEAEKTIQHIQPKIIEAEKTIIEAEKTIQHIQPKIIEAEKTIIEAEKTIQHIQPKIIEAEKTIQHIQPKIIEAEKTIIEAEKTIQHIQPKIIEAEKTIQHIKPIATETQQTFFPLNLPSANPTYPDNSNFQINISPQFFAEISPTQLPHPPSEPIHQKVSPILIVDQSSSKLQFSYNVLAPASHIQSAHTSQNIPLVVDPSNPSNLIAKKNTISSQSDIGEDYLQYIEIENSIQNAFLPQKLPFETKPQQKQQIESPPSSQSKNNKFKINQEVVNYNIIPAVVSKPASVNKLINKQKPQTSKIADKKPESVVSNKSDASMGKIDIKYNEYKDAPLDKSFMLSIVQYDSPTPPAPTPPKKFANLIQNYKKSTISQKKQQPIIQKELIPTESQIQKQKQKTKSERIFNKKDFLPIQVPEPSQKSITSSVNKKSFQDKKNQMTPNKIHERQLQKKESQIKRIENKQIDQDSKSNRLSVVSPQKSDRSELKRKSRKRIDFQHDGHIDFKYINTVKPDDMKSVSAQEVKFIKNPTELGGEEKNIQAEIIHLKKLGSDGKSIRSFRDIHNIKFKHDADDQARYSIRQVEERQPRNFVEVSQRYKNLTPNKLVTKSEKFDINQIKTQRITRRHQDDSVLKPKDNSKAPSKDKGSQKKVETPKILNIQVAQNKPILNKIQHNNKVVDTPSQVIDIPSKVIETSTKKQEFNMDMIDDLMGIKKKPIRRQRNEEVGQAPEKSYLKVQGERKEMKSAPKELETDKSRKDEGLTINKNELSKIGQSKLQGDSKSNLRMTRFMSRTPQPSDVGRQELRRKSRKHIDFQHDGHIDFKFNDKVKMDPKASSILDKDVKFIKNASESGGGSSQIIEAEILHLRNLGTDGKSIRHYRDSKDILFKHDADDEAQYSIREPQQSNIKNYVQVGKDYLTPNKQLIKERTKTERFEPANKLSLNTERVPRKTEHFTSDIAYHSKLLSKIEPVLEIESPVKEKSYQTKDKKETNEQKEGNKPTPNRLQRRSDYRNDLVDDLLGFGKPRRSQVPETQKKEEFVQHKSGLGDKFIQQVKQTNKIIREQRKN